MDRIVLISLLIITALEQLFPRRRQAFFRKGFFEDLTYIFLIYTVTVHLNQYVFDAIDFLKNYSVIKPSFTSKALEFTLCLLLFDFIRYLLHRLMHQLNILWHIHKLHHTPEELSSISAFRTSYFEELAIILFSIPFVTLVAFDTNTIIQCEVLFAIHGYFLHSNIKIRFRGAFSLICCPYFHASHHKKNKIYSFSNYGATFTFWDRIFKTYHLPDNLEFNNLGLYEADGEDDKIKQLNPVLKYFYFPFWRK